MAASTLQIIITTMQGQPVSVNHAYRKRWRGAPGKGMFMTEEGKSWKEVVRLSCIAAMNLYGITVKPPCRITVDYYFPNRRRRDSHNYAKLLVDGCAMALGFDDSLITYQDGTVDIDREDPRVEIHIEEAK